MSQGDDRPLLPDQTSDDDPDNWRRGSGDDEFGDGSGSKGGCDPDDERILRERPPHW